MKTTSIDAQTSALLLRLGRLLRLVTESTIQISRHRCSSLNMSAGQIWLDQRMSECLGY